MKKFIKKRLVQVLLAAVLVVGCFAGIGNNEAEAAQNSLKVRVGFYGGPYYDIHTFSYSEMCSLADGQVYTYSGADSGGFMRLCYAWGVPLSRIISQSGVDLNSVKYLHMTTTDGFAESRSTFSVGTLLNTSRYFYPNMVKLVDPNGSDQEQTIAFDQVTEEHTSGAQKVPTILAIGSTNFSRENAVSAGKNGYTSYSTGDLPQDHQYRLIYGQTGLGNIDQAMSAQTSAKYVTDIDIQLAGAPNITMEKTLISGEEGKIGSKYSVKLNASLPDSYSYIPAEIRQQLLQQVYDTIEVKDYDSSVVNVTKKSDGTYELEVIGEGNTELKFLYSRKEFKNDSTSNHVSTSVSGMKVEGGSDVGNADKNQSDTITENEIDQTDTAIKEAEASTKPNTDNLTEEKEETNIGLVEETQNNTHDNETDNKTKLDTQIVSGKKWMAIGNVVMEEVIEQGNSQASDNAAIQVEQVSVKGMAAGGSAVCLGFGFIVTLITYYRRR